VQQNQMSSRPGASRTEAIPVDRRWWSVRPLLHRRLLALFTHLAWLTSVGTIALVSVLPSTGIVARDTSEGIRVLAREKSLAEQFLVIMNDFGRKDIDRFATGIALYAKAKAEFDGLITQLEHELEQAQPPSQSEKFEAVLKEAVAKRVAFTSFVTDTLVPHTEGTRKGIVGDFIKGGADLIKALTEAGIAIWREFRSSDEARRTEIRQELESLRWPQFTAPGGK
jgi:hypothetical protein